VCCLLTKRAAHGEAPHTMEDVLVNPDLFSLFNREIYGPEPGEVMDLTCFEDTLVYLDLDPTSEFVRYQLGRWWKFWGGSLQLV